MNSLVQVHHASRRSVVDIFNGQATSDGAGVSLTRIIGSRQLDMLDPFLLLDCFESDKPQDYIGGFPTHPHRGFETVTYLLNGRMRHKDSTGHEGVIEPGGVQWMTAGRGILHSEMPEQKDGLLQGFQLWVNLPAKHKMTAPKYQEYPPQTVPLEQREDGVEVRVIAGKTDQGTLGPVVNEYTHPVYMDVRLPVGPVFTQSLVPDHTGFVYVISGALAVKGEDEKTVKAKQLAVLSKGEQLAVNSVDGQTRFLLLAGQPFNEPVVRAGPFVMNTQQEILQAFSDFNGRRNDQE